MQRPRLQLVAAFVMILWLCAALDGRPANAFANRLDGRVFSGKMAQKRPNGSDAGWEKDSIVFSNGKLRSEALERLGFHETEYTVSLTRQGIVFEAIFDHDDGGRVFWKGTIRGLKALAVATWTHQGSEAEEYDFSGVLTRGKRP